MNRDDHQNGRGLAMVAGLLADQTRATFCVALLDGRAWTPTELARYAVVAKSTATEHLNKLVTGGLLAEVRQSRHRYLRLAGPEAAELVENLTAVTPGATAPVRSLSTANRRRALAYARTCYDHLAGTLGVAIADSVTGLGLLDQDRGLSLTSAGVAWLADLGIAVDDLRAARRPMVRTCLDWTERRPHLAGAVGVALCRHALAAGWITQIATSRAVRVTDLGRRELMAALQGLSLSGDVSRETARAG